MMRRVGLFLLLAFVASCKSCGDAPIAPFPKSQPLTAADRALGPGDVVEIRVYGEPDLTGTFDVGVDGNINFPLIGIVQVDGVEAPAVRDEIQRRLADGYLRNPSVTVRVTEYRSKKVTVEGEVRAPSTFPYTDNMGIREAISRAGGFTAMARRNAVKVTRIVQGKSEVFVVAVDEISKGKAPDFLVHPGDNVHVDQRPF
jgi:protein involved in polysaccharide export with SLBB domain